MNVSGILRKTTIAAVLVGGLVFVLWPDQLTVDAQTITSGPLSVYVQAEGRTRPRDRYVISASSAGRLLRPSWREGDAVQKSELLGRILPPSSDARSQRVVQTQLQVAQAQEQAAQATLQQAKAEHVLAKNEWRRNESLYKKGHISKEILDRFEQAARVADAQRVAAQASLESAHAGVAEAQAQLQGLDANGTDLSLSVAVLSPIAGTVLKVHQKSEKLVQAGEPLFDIAATEGLEIEVDLLTRSAVSVQAGAAILIDDWGGSETLHGTVRYIEPDAFTKISALGVEEQRVNVIGDFRSLPSGLGSGYRLNVRISTWQGEDVLQIPTSALFRREQAWYCFVVNEGRAELRELSIGQRAVEAAEVLAGLEAGEQVIVFPSDQLEAGRRVHVSAYKEAE